MILADYRLLFAVKAGMLALQWRAEQRYNGAVSEWVGSDEIYSPEF